MVGKMICTCCGLVITEKYHKTKQGFVCSSCWNDPNLFFPEKIRNSSNWEEITTMLDSKLTNSDILKLPVIRLKQKNVTLYSGKLRAGALLKLYAVFSFEEETFTGYQRELYDEKINELYQYLTDCPVAVMPGLFISIREGAIFSLKYEQEDIGTLEIPMRKGALWVIDGQHRIGSFEKMFAQFQGEDYTETSFNTLMDYEIPVTFIDCKEATEIFSSEGTKLLPEDIERTIFFIINKTQHRLNPSLKDALQYCIKRAGLNGIPAIEKEIWRTEATSIVIDLNSLEASPFYNKINISGRRGLNKPVQLNSFVSSLRLLYKNKNFIQLSNAEQKTLLIQYWKAIERINIDAFKDDTYRKYIITKAFGIYVLNYILVDFIEICSKKNLNVLENSIISKFVNGMKGFVWSKEASPIAHYGGLGGVKEALNILRNHMSTSFANESNK